MTGINKTTDAVTLTYAPWGSACLDDAVGELECQGRRVVADREGVGADNGGGDGPELYYLRPVKDCQSQFLENGWANTYF